MKDVNGVRYYTIGEVAVILHRTPTTLRAWEKSSYVLPAWRRDLDGRSTRFMDGPGIDKLRTFRDNVTYGKLAAGRGVK